MDKVRKEEEIAHAKEQERQLDQEMQEIGKMNVEKEPIKIDG